MSRFFRQLSSTLPFLRHVQPAGAGGVAGAAASGAAAAPPDWQKQWARGIRVRVLNGNLEQALALMQRKMTSSGMERLIRRRVDHHLKDSEKRVLARKKLEMRVRSQDLARKLRTILVKKIRGL